jgi:hypothetical protein
MASRDLEREITNLASRTPYGRIQAWEHLDECKQEYLRIWIDSHSLEKENLGDVGVH